MKLCKLTCMAPIGVVVEDLGVRLAGRGSSQLVSAQSAMQSQDLKKLANIVRVEYLPEPRPVPVWPFIKSKPAPPPLPEAPAPPDVSRQLEALGRQQAEILNLLRSGSLSIPSQSNAQPAVQTVQAPSEPMFIPSQIVPEVQDVRVKVREGEVDKSDMGASLEALRRLKKGK